jgi:uncharacterized membrane protein YhaH (DUF805 family)
MNDLLFSFDGRINRSRFWTGVAVLVAIYIVLLVLNLIAGLMFGESVVTLLVGIVSIAVYLAMIWPSIALGVKRFHDRNKSGWWVLISLVPIIGGIWYLVECGFLEGTRGPNQFGPDPLPSPAIA